MDNSNFNQKVLNAAKWSSITEILAKIVSPITNMILARILVPEAFGVVATITMIISLADMFADAGFQKYLVQHNFKNEEEKNKSANVAFLTNLTLSLFLWIIIFLFRDQIAAIVGNPGLGNAIAVACIQLPLVAFSSIQLALYRRDFDFKMIFMIRTIAIFIPFIVTIPLALLGLGFWSLIIGGICMQLSNALILVFKSKWKPSSFFDITVLKNMLSFSLWSLVEAMSIWLTTWIDAFIIASALNEYYLGIYKTSTTLVNSLMAIITASIVPVLFATLSRLQNNSIQFNQTFINTQRIVSIFVLPLGMGVYLYSDLATDILLGSQWSESSEVIGIWALTSSMVIVLSHFCSEVYRAKGKPKLSFLTQILHLITLVPVCIISSQYGFLALVYARSLIRFQGTLVHFIVMKYVIKFPLLIMIKNIVPAFISTIGMGVMGYYLKKVSTGTIWSVSSIFICLFFYFSLLTIFPNTRTELRLLKRWLFERKRNPVQQ